MTPFAILKRTPKTNCGQCGHPTCLAFAAMVAKGGEDPRKCPFIDLQGLEPPEASAPDRAHLGQQRDLALIAHLKQKIAPADFSRIAPSLGAHWESSSPDALSFIYLGRQAVLSKNGILLDGQEPEDPRDQILLYNYVHSGGGRPPAGDWIGLESLPNSISKVRTLAVYSENRLAGLFTGKTKETLLERCRNLLGREEHGASATLGVIIPVLPRVPQYLLFWEAEPEEGFAPKVKILFDRHVPDYLDLESLVFSAERLADRLLAMMG